MKIEIIKSLKKNHYLNIFLLSSYLFVIHQHSPKINYMPSYQEFYLPVLDFFSCLDILNSLGMFLIFLVRDKQKIIVITSVKIENISPKELVSIK